MKNTLNKGFTLVELLIVIVIIGILSIAIFAAIDPIDQTRRGQDTATRSFATQISQAITRYYANNGSYPWTDVEPSATALNELLGTDKPISTLVSAGELNQNFEQIAKPYADKIFVTESQTEGVSVCFKPASKAFKTDPNNIYDKQGTSTLQSGGTPTCRGTTDTCHICIK